LAERGGDKQAQHEKRLHRERKSCEQFALSWCDFIHNSALDKV
jgi:hypothetical protein